MSDRIRKVNELIRKEVGNFFLAEHFFARDVFVTVTKVDTSPDLYYSTVFLSVIPKNRQGSVLEAAGHGIRRIQRHLNDRLIMKYVPQVRFKIDPSEEKIAHIEKLLGKQKNHPTQHGTD